MARYIDMDNLKEMIEAKADTLIEGKEAFLYVAKWLDLLPSVEVIRCKDCVYSENCVYIKDAQMIYCKLHDTSFDKNGFCSYAKMKGNTENIVKEC